MKKVIFKLMLAIAFFVSIFNNLTSMESKNDNLLNFLVDEEVEDLNHGKIEDLNLEEINKGEVYEKEIEDRDMSILPSSLPLFYRLNFFSYMGAYRRTRSNEDLTKETSKKIKELNEKHYREMSKKNKRIK